MQPEQLEQPELPDPRGKILYMQSIDLKNVINYTQIHLIIRVCVCVCRPPGSSGAAGAAGATGKSASIQVIYLKCHQV